MPREHAHEPGIIGTPLALSYVPVALRCYLTYPAGCQQ